MEKIITKHGWACCIVLLTFMLLLSGVVNAQDPNLLTDVEVMSVVQQRMQQRISVDFRETPIEDVLRALAGQADVDIVKSPEVVGNVTATLTDIPLSEALDNILAAHGYGFIATENMIRVVPRKDIVDVKEKIVSKIFRLNYADVKDVEKALRKFLSKQGSLSANPGTSNIIVTDVESKIEAINSFIDEIDRKTPQVMVEVRIYDVTSSEDLELGVEWLLQRNVDVSTIEREKTTGADATVTSVVDGVITETIGTGTTETITKTSTGYRSKPWIGGRYDQDSGGTIAFGLLNDAVDFTIALNILHKEGAAKLLANPRIMVLDNETATFEIIKEIPYKEERAASGGGILTQTEFKEVGVKLLVTPHVTREDMLRLHIMPEFGVAEEQLRNPITREPIVPTINTRKLDTIALVKDNQTVVLGGLRQSETTKDYWKTPLLGDLPLIGDLFTSESESVEVTELIIFITPTIIKEQPVLKVEEEKVLENTDIPSPNPKWETDMEFREEDEKVIH